MRVLLVEDDPMIGQSLKTALHDEGMAVDWVQSGDDAGPALDSSEYSVVLLDLNLPGMSGMEILKRMRMKGAEVPVLIISARDKIDDRLDGLDLGADDYLVKPFDMRELLSRMRVLVRRNSGQAVSVLTNGQITLDLATHSVTYKGHSEQLNAKPFAILSALMKNPGHVWSKSRLEEIIYGWDQDFGSNTVEVLIHGIRKRFSKDIILNVRGTGWKVRETTRQ